MPTWPTSEKYQPQTRRTSTRQKRLTEPYPHLQQGSVTAVSLYENNRQLEWTSVVRSTQGPRLVPKGKSSKIFPETRPLPLSVPKTRPIHLAEQGEHFIRTKFPDVDIPSELLRDAVLSERRFSRSLAQFDPLKGKLIESIQCHGHSSEDTSSYLLFPVGESNLELNASPLVYKESQGVVFEPVAAPIWTSNTPIYQLEAFSARNGQHARLAVRTLSCISFWNLHSSAVDGANSSPKLTHLYNVHRVNIGDMHAVDMKFLVAPQAILVNDRGAVYLSHFVNGRNSMQLCTLQSEEPTGNKFWRLATTQSSDGFLLASDTWLRRLDLRSKHDFLDMFACRDVDERLACVEGHQNDHLFRLATTREIIWVDERSARKPILAYQHDRQFEQSLRIQTLPLPTPTTFLTSQRNGIVTVYDMSFASDDGMIHVNTLPYSLSAAAGSSGPHQGYLFLRQPSVDDGADLAAFQLSERGSIHRLDFCRSAQNPASPAERLNFNWSADMERLNANVAKLRTDPGPSARREFTTVDFTPAYGFLCRGLEANAEKLDYPIQLANELFKKIPSFWQEQSLLQGHFVSTFEIALFESEPNQTSRANFLASGLLDSPAAFQALKQGCEHTTRLINEARWHYNVGRTVPHVLRDMSQDPQTLFNMLYEFHPQRGQEREPDHRTSTICSRTCEQLVTDLILSADVFTARPIAKPVGSATLDTLETMSRAGEAMSLSNESHPIVFGYLKPTAKHTGRDPVESDPRSGISLPIGTRLLLNEWEIGTDPRRFVFKDPYGVAASEVSTPAKAPATQNSTRFSTSQRARQPLVVITSQPSLASAPRSGSLGQPRFSGNLQRLTSTPDAKTEQGSLVVESTQEGGRKKKRIGGF